MVEIISKLQDFVLKCSRVWTIMRKPTKEELKITAQAAGIGMLLVGLFGFLISTVMRLILANKIL